MDKTKKFQAYDRQPHKNLHTAISVNKPKLSVTKHDQTLIWAAPRRLHRELKEQDKIKVS